MKPRIFPVAAAVAALLAPVTPGLAQPAQSIGVRDSFRIGSGASVLCTAQAMIADRALVDMFDQGYVITCRDAALPVGRIYALRARGPDPIARLAALRSETMTCDAPAAGEIEGLGPVDSQTCRGNAADLAYRVHVRRAGNILYIAEGLGGYDSALQLGLRSVIEDREVAGEVSVATTGAGDPAAFARAQAGSLDAQRALAEAYRRNNAGSYADAAEFFARLGEVQTDAAGRAEALVNEALQLSNLGRYAEAEPLFARAALLGESDPVTARRLRNYRTIHLLNQGLVAEALAELNRPLPVPPAGSALRDLQIDAATARRLSMETPGARRFGATGLTPEDKALILDGQALQLRGTMLRLLDRPAEAVEALNQALGQLQASRNGRLAATVWMRAQIHGELADVAEGRNDAAEAERQHRAALALLETDYPGSSALLSARGRLAGYHVRSGRADAAIPLFREIVETVSTGGDSSPSLRRMLDPYFELLAQRAGDPAAAADMFAASQILVRPGVAQTQAVLARELSGGSDEAARLFRQSVTLTRDIERARVELARIEGGPDPSSQAARIAALRFSLDQLQLDQSATQARLANFPRYRAVAGNAIALADLQQLLRPGEAYYKMMVVNDDAYAIFVTPTAARGFRVGATPGELESQVDALRATISLVRNGQQMTYPFDVDLAHRLYDQLFGSVAADLAGVSHLIFEPDGAMLRLPPNVLIMDRGGIEAYRARVAVSSDHEFDFRGIQWLGRERDISTAVSARAFRDVRQAPPSRAAAQYIGFGENVPATGFFRPASAGVRGAGDSGVDCSWSLAAWNRPISSAELFTARRAIASETSGEAEIVTGGAFTDNAIKQRGDLDRYRILHFATHGLVGAPRPECPSRPALLTSFGGEESDGLLTFAEIFDLRLDADIIVLSACDTAGGAGLAATREAGLTTGGDFALDGLVRAFIGAGGRLVVASHWPVPDDYNATQRLISGLFTASPGTSVAAALRAAEQALMDEADTSHPYYWAGFAVIGDGAMPVIRPEPVRTASAN